MDILTTIKKLATNKANQASVWKLITGNLYSAFDSLVQALTNYKIGKLDAKIAELSSLEGAELPSNVKTIILDSIKNTASMVSSVETIGASTFEDSSIVYLPTLEVAEENVTACCKNCSMLMSVEPLDFSSVKYGKEMFYNCTHLKYVLISDLSSLKTGAYAFSKCTSLTTILFSDLSSLTDGSYMFSGCLNLEEFAISDLPALSAGSYMFSQCYSFSNLQLSVPSLINGDGMFYGCSSLKSITLSGLSNLSNGGSMFRGCGVLANLTFDSFQSVKNANSMFYGCYNLASLDELYLPLISSANFMFQSCSALSSIVFKEGSFAVASSLLGIFYGCTKLKSIVGLRLSGLYLDYSTGVSESSYQQAVLLSLPSSLTDCELQGTLYRSGFTLTGCPNLSAASLFSWVAALYDWETNSESKTTIDSDHTLYLTSEQLSTLEEYEGDGTMTGAEVIEQAISYGWNLSE